MEKPVLTHLCRRAHGGTFREKARILSAHQEGGRLYGEAQNHGALAPRWQALFPCSQAFSSAERLARKQWHNRVEKCHYAVAESHYVI